MHATHEGLREMRLSIRCIPWRGFILTDTASLIVLSTHTTHPKRKHPTKLKLQL